MKLSKIKPAHIQSYYSDFLSKRKIVKKKNHKKEWIRVTLDEKYSSTTVLQNHRILHRAFVFACNQGYIDSNPCDYVTAPKKAKFEIKIPSDNELLQLYEISKGTPYFLPIYIASTTGMRSAEICGLLEENVTDKYYVKYQLQRLKGRIVLDDTKTKGSKRNITFMGNTKKQIDLHRLEKKRIKIHYSKMLKDMFAVYNSDGIEINVKFLCCHKDNSPILPDTLSKQFASFINQLGMDPDITFHSLRHYHATWLLKNDVHPKIVSERLGHSKIQITLDTYSHMIPGLQEKALLNLETKLFDIDEEKHNNYVDKYKAKI